MIGLENLCTGISLAGQSMFLAGRMAQETSAEGIGIYLQELERTFEPTLMGVNFEVPEAMELNPLLRRLDALRDTLEQRKSSEEIYAARDALSNMLQGITEWKAPRILADKGETLATVKARLFPPHEQAESAYRARQLYMSDGGVLPIIDGISKVQFIGDTNHPTVLFVSLFPAESNGSGTYTKAMLEYLSAQGVQAGSLFLGHRFDPTMATGVSQYLVPFTPDRERPLAGAALRNLPVFDSNPASPAGTRFRNMKPEELNAYTEGLCDAVRVAVDNMKPDALVVNHSFVGAEAARRTRLPFVVVCHGTCANLMKEAQNGSGPFPNNLADLVLPGMHRADKVVAITDEVGGDIQKAYGIGPERIVTIPNGFHSDIFVPAPRDRRAVLEQLGIPSQGITHIVSFAGRMVDYKGVSTLLEAASMIKDQMPSVHFLLAGNGQQKNEFVALSERLGLEGRVHFLGHLDLETSADLHRIADIGVVPSWREPFGIVPLEIAGTGTPVIASDVGGLKETVRGSVGVRVPPRDPQQLARAIMTALQQDLKLAVGSAASAHVHATYPWEVGGERLLDLLRDVTGHSNQRAAPAREASGLKG